MILIRGKELPINVKAEIESFDWEKPNWKEERLIACSPFRDETHPSFAVNLENGTFIDSGNDDEQWRKGNFVKLLSWIRRESYEETEEYLLAMYSPDYGDIENFELNFDDWKAAEVNKRIFDRSELKPYLFKHPYLERRGVPFNVQRAFEVGYEPETKSIVLVWHDMKGNVISWKHRSVHSKAFWYVKGGQPIRNHLYGIHWVVHKGKKEVWIVESEIDALTLWAKGIAAIAIGTSNLTKAKRDIILKSGIETLIIATDNDKAGEKARKSIIDRLGGLVDLYEVDWSNVPEELTDINEAREHIDGMKIVELNAFEW
ncbi:toprim domain-containing protein [Halobacillus ihumii]|uniref:toprim domain-containing protein n=1 Tax=Halobacillus ihumii TaxID=2686092 RepID=UPI0013D5BBED|nr:toprim domain-containing protein [Halobacillus ihumii]